ncbi:keratin, type I cytoskeletal 18-like [Cyclopterus lumpus]|uniref:keratin, type I cytoskeletal 18-like n=1 Tax=Cyclopterus lumpus TaxID=8103 RepID=UPI001486DBF3|nr:keratin, type I cytoskeletal 18-like [Cyclopterus lumpus]
MPSHTAASMFGGAGGRGSRVSVASLMGLRNVLRNETDRDSAPAAHAEPPADAAAPAEPPAGDKHTLRSLNDRLSGYLLRARQLEKENQDLENEIDGILAKRKTLEVRDWNEVEKPLDNLNKQIKDIAMDNAKLLLQIGNNNLANEDFKKKLDDEKKAGKELEKDLQDLKNTREDSNLNNTQIKREIDLVKEDLARLEQEHKEEVDVLLEKVKDSEVKVEMESRSSDLGEVVNKIRYQYDKLAKKNLEDTEEWYQNKFENIKVAEAQNNEHLESGKSELKGLHVEKRALEIKLQGFLSKIYNLEEALNRSKVEHGQRLGPLNQTILHLEAELKELRAQVERHAENNRNLLCVKMKLEAEMDNYQRLMQGITAEAESLDFSLEDALHSGQQKPDDEVPKQRRRVEDEAPVKRGESTPPKGDLVQDEKVAVNNAAAPAAPSKNKKDSSSSSSSENEDEKPKKEEEVAKT